MIKLKKADPKELIKRRFNNAYTNCIQKCTCGVNPRRNYGLKFAKGEYIGFVDSDDYVDFDMFRMLYEKAKEKEFDMVVCDLATSNSLTNTNFHR